MSKLILPTPRLASSWSTVADDGSTYYGFPSLAKSLDGSTYYLAYKIGDHNQYPPQTIVFRTRAANGSVWSSPVTVTSYDVGTDRAPADPDLLVTSTGRILLFTTRVNNGGSFWRRPEIWRSDDGGTTWTQGTIGLRFAAWSTPCKAVQIGSTIYLVQYGKEASGDVGYQAGLMASADDGVTWASSDLIASGIAVNYSYEEPGIAQLSDGRIVCILRTDERQQLMLSSVDAIGGTWRFPSTFARGYAKAGFALFPDDRMLFCQRWPGASTGGWGVAFYTAKLGADGVIATSQPAFLDDECLPGGSTRMMYAGLEAISDTTALVAVSVDDGTYTGRAWIRVGLVSIR